MIHLEHNNMNNSSTNTTCNTSPSPSLSISLSFLPHRPTVRQMLERGIDPNISNADGLTPLHKVMNILLYIVLYQQTPFNVYIVSWKH